ncbi:hypothetical protein C8R43DRAFT_1005410 [Mycena crocata]|nr:hypothetical protein C8R43DRAFT_1005410 [Mycena crocata]
MLPFMLCIYVQTSLTHTLSFPPFLQRLHRSVAVQTANLSKKQRFDSSCGHCIIHAAFYFFPFFFSPPHPPTHFVLYFTRGSKSRVSQMFKFCVCFYVFLVTSSQIPRHRM